GGCYIDPGEPDNDTGTIRIHLSLQQGRDLGSEDSETASGLSDMYEIIVYNESDQISSVLSPESTMSTITASAGRYTVVVAAGFTHSGQVVLLGSGIQENVDVVSNS
ncbi:MAG: hypothetical protein GWN14_00110, partial [candidate division Zixibacteria bacterium]|nr:hypothetical protein [Phycisphaerae bacterium]NIW39020.1 hypothetical protein [candidate division Zixibacteria bacterium]NIX54365.1 hypothetical protein [candidate division Zixibacteria bacterium]